MGQNEMDCVVSEQSASRLVFPLVFVTEGRCVAPDSDDTLSVCLSMGVPIPHNATSTELGVSVSLSPPLLLPKGRS